MTTSDPSDLWFALDGLAWPGTVVRPASEPPPEEEPWIVHAMWWREQLEALGWLRTEWWREPDRRHVLMVAPRTYWQASSILWLEKPATTRIRPRHDLYSRLVTHREMFTLRDLARGLEHVTIDGHLVATDRSSHVRVALTPTERKLLYQAATSGASEYRLAVPAETGPIRDGEYVGWFAGLHTRCAARTVLGGRELTIVEFLNRYMGSPGPDCVPVQSPLDP